MLTYSSLLSKNPNRLCETPSRYDFLTERHLQAMWYEQKYFEGLTSSEGEIISVISPGIWNFGGGPDFCKAHLLIGTKEYQGDIEIHFSDTDWYQHQHHEDARYNQVILHLSLWKSQDPKPIKTFHQKEVSRAYLDPCLTVSSQHIVQSIDLDLYPYQKFLGSGKCAHTVFHHLSEDQVHQFFQSASLWRLEKKREYLNSRVPEVSWQMGAGVAMALGYKHNTEAFLDLFLFLMTYRDLPEEELLSLALGACGFFEERYTSKWSSSDYYCALHSFWGRWISEATHQTQLRLDQVRPLNHPIRRLVYLVKLIGRSSMDSLWDGLTESWLSGWKVSKSQQKWRQLLDHMREKIPSFTDSYWNSHYLFETTPQHRFLPLIGEDLKSSILINTFFPLLYHKILQNIQVQELEAFGEFYHSLTAQKNSKSDYLSHRFFGETPKKSVFRKASIEQGAFQLHRDFCIHYEASCVGCPFVERFRQSFST